MRRRTFLKGLAAFVLPWTRLLDLSVREPALPAVPEWPAFACTMQLIPDFPDHVILVAKAVVSPDCKWDLEYLGDG